PALRCGKRTVMGRIDSEFMQHERKGLDDRCRHSDVRPTENIAGGCERRHLFANEFLKRSGAQFWNRLHLSPIHGDDGRIQYFFGSKIDMTEYRRIEALEASKHRLLME
ncbi:hypothetical protein ACC870_36950, partial [Rhizobium ruizarguesonis]